MKKILFAVGTRPEVIKLCPLYKKARESGKINARLLSTGQHADMLFPHMRELSVTPDISLLSAGGELCRLGAELLEGACEVIKREKPDAVAVQGDTVSAFFCALAAFYLGVRVVHIEAGLRSHNPKSPFPEEANRKMLAALADIHIAPNERAKSNLIAEGVGGKIFVTGNTVTDALVLAIDTDYKNPYTEGEFALVTAHRRESGERELAEMMQAVAKIAAKYPSLALIFPVHPSPRVRAAASGHLADTGVIMTDPMSLYDFHNLEYRARFVLSDSGGVQEECAALGTPVLVMRENTEREVELMERKITLCGRKTEEILRAVDGVMSCAQSNRHLPESAVCDKIVEILLNEL